MYGKGVDLHINLIPKVIFLKLFLDMVPGSPADNVTRRVAWMFLQTIKMSVKLLELFT